MQSSAEMQSSAYSSDDSNSDTDSCSCTSDESECDEWTDVDNDRMPVFTYCNSSIDNNMVRACILCLYMEFY